MHSRSPEHTEKKGFFGGPPGLFKENDWRCENCQNINFSWRTMCNKCKYPKHVRDRDRFSRNDRERDKDRDRDRDYKRRSDQDSRREYKKHDKHTSSRHKRHSSSSSKSKSDSGSDSGSSKSRSSGREDISPKNHRENKDKESNGSQSDSESLIHKMRFSEKE